MKNRGDCDAAIISRLLQDEKENWHDKLNNLIWDCRISNNRRIYLFDMHADDDLASVVTRAERHMGVNL
jgi:hypothetical protein